MTLARSVALLGALLLAPSAALAQTSEAPPFGSLEQQMLLVAQVCQNQLNIGREGCACLANRTRADLSTEERDYLLASVLAPASAERMAAKLGQPGLQKIALFLEEAAGACSAGPGAPAQPAAPAPPARPQ